MYEDLFPDAAETAFKARLIRPEIPKPLSRFNAWGLLTAPVKGIEAGAGQGLGSISDLLGAFGQALATTEPTGGGMFRLPSKKEAEENRLATEKLRKDGLDFMSEAGRSFRNVAKDYTPDAATAHVSERLVFDVFRLGGKAITSAAIFGNIPGAIVAGFEEGFTESDELAQAGVDLATRTKVGAMSGAINAAGFALPVAGKTWLKTAGLAAAGGPVSFMSQNAASRAILQNADYSKLADHYDPFDPLGLVFSTVVPFGFGALAMKARGLKAADAEIKPTDEMVDAARTSLLKESVDKSNKLPSDIEAIQANAVAHSDAFDQLSNGQKVDVVSKVTEEMSAKITEDVSAKLDDIGKQIENVKNTPAIKAALEESGDIGKAYDGPASDIPTDLVAGAKTETQEPKSFLDAEIERLVKDHPNVEVLLDDAENSMNIAEAMAKLDEDIKQDKTIAEFIQPAIECFLSGD